MHSWCFYTIFALSSHKSYRRNLILNAKTETKKNAWLQYHPTVPDYNAIKLDDDTKCYHYLMFILCFWISKYDIKCFTSYLHQITIYFITSFNDHPTIDLSRTVVQQPVYGLHSLKKHFRNIKNSFKFPNFLFYHTKNLTKYKFKQI